VLRLGADLDTVTLLHHAEYLASLPAKRRVRRLRRVRGPAGPALRWVECLDDEEGIVDRPGEDYFALILKDYLRTGRAAAGSVGQARSELIDARDLVAYGAAWMADQFGASGTGSTTGAGAAGSTGGGGAT
jgi:aminoglycoside N3'-acetyltransferase